MASFAHCGVCTTVTRAVSLHSHIASHDFVMRPELGHGVCDWCREALLRAAGSPELFLSMRAAYIASLAAVSMGGYIAGVGDRHMDNFLLDMSSGALVPIDFG